MGRRVVAYGLPGKMLEVGIDFTKAPDPSSPGNHLLVVSAEAELVAEDLDQRERSGALATTTTRRTWRIPIDEAQQIRLEELP